MAASSDSKQLTANVMKLFTRPKSHHENLKEEEVTVSVAGHELLYIGSCSNCVFTVKSKIAKCIIEKSDGIKIHFQEPIISGTLEVIKSSGVTVSCNPDLKIPVLFADRSSDLHFHMNSPHGVGVIYTNQCSDVSVHMITPHPLEQRLDLPAEGSENWEQEYLSRYSEGKMITVKGIRVGSGYLTTEQDEEVCQQRANEIEKRITEYLTSNITIHKPGKRPQHKVVEDTPSKDNQ